MTTDVLHNQSAENFAGPNLTFDLGNQSRPLSQSSFESVDMSVVHIPEGLKEELQEAWPAKCVYPVLEILQTEESYVQSLEQMLKGYRDPLCNWLQSFAAGEEFIRDVFLNLGELFNVHRRLLQNLQDTASDPREFGQVFVKAENDFSGYTYYCTHFNSATELLRQTTEANTELKTFVQMCQRELHHNLPLEAYLIRPVQRILKYHLLLQSVLKHFNTEHHAHPSLKAALAVMKRTAEHINNVKKQMENTIRAKEIQQSLCGGPSGKLTIYGELRHECKCKVHVGRKGGERERELILFEKLLLLLKRKDSKRYNYKGHIEVSELSLDEVEAEPLGFKVFSSRGRPSQAFHILVRSEKVKQEWVERIGKVIKCNSELMKKKRLEMSVNMRKQRYSYSNSEPRMMLASEHTRKTMESMHSSNKSRKRKALSEVFDVEESVKLTKVNQIKSDRPEIQLDELREGERQGEREGWMMEGEEQRVPDSSSVALPVISEEGEGSIFSQSHTDLLKPSRYTGSKSKMSSSVSLESLVSLSDVELGEEEEGAGSSHAPFFGRYVEECDSGDVREGSVERESGEGPKKMPRQTSGLRRKPAIRVKTVSASSTNSPASARRQFSRFVIREKAQLARADSYSLPEVDSSPPGHVTESADPIGPDDQTRSHDTSLDSSTGLPNQDTSPDTYTLGVESSSSDLDSSSASVSVTMATVVHGDRGEEPEMGEGEGQSEAAGSQEAMYIVDSSDSEEEEEEEEEELSGASVEEDLGSSLEQTTTVSRQQSISTSSSHDDQSSDQPLQTAVEESDGGPSAVSDSHSAGLGMEDSGFGTGESAGWRLPEHESPTDIGEAPPTTDFSSPHSTLAEHYATLPRKPQAPKPPTNLHLPRDFSPGPRSHKSSSPSSTSSSVSRTTTRKSRGFSRLVEYTRKLSSPSYSENSDLSVSQSLPPGSLSGRIIEEPLEGEFVGGVFDELLAGEEGEEEGNLMSVPPPKKQALESLWDQLEPQAAGEEGDEVGKGESEVFGAPADLDTREISPEAVSSPDDGDVAIETPELGDQPSEGAGAGVGEDTTGGMETPTDMQMAVPLIEGREDDSVTPQPPHLEEYAAAEGDKMAAEIEPAPGEESGERERMEEGEENVAEVRATEDDREGKEVGEVEKVAVSLTEPAVSEEERETGDAEKVEEPVVVEPGTDEPEGDVEKVEMAAAEPAIDEGEGEVAKTEPLEDEMAKENDVQLEDGMAKENDVQLEDEMAKENDVQLEDEMAKENGVQSAEAASTEEDPERTEPLSSEDVTRESQLEEREWGRDGSLPASDPQLSRRVTQIPGNEPAQPVESAVAQVGSSLGLLGTLRRLREWTRFRNRRLLLFGTVGFLTIASVVFLGVNLFYDSKAQAKRPAAGAL